MFDEENIPQISVLLATYEGAKWLASAIDSILNQTFTDFELVIVYDDSPDDTKKILDAYAKKDRRIKVLRQQEKGLPQARNEGMRHLRGRYVALMDDDDLSLPTRLEEQLRFLKQHPEFAACVSFSRLLEGTRIIAPELSKKCHYEHLKHTDEELKSIPPLPLILSARTMMTREALEVLGGWRPFFRWWCEDVDLSLRFQEKFQVAELPQILYEYRDPSNSIWEEHLTTKDPINVLKYLWVSYISAWCRRNGHADPIEQGEDLEEVIQIGSQLAQSVRFHILSNCSDYMFDVILSKPDLSTTNVVELCKLLRQLDAKGDLRFLQRYRKRLWTVLARQKKYRDVLYLTCYGLRRLILANLRRDLQ